MAILTTFLVPYLLLPTHLILEAEDAHLKGLEKAASRSGFSGKGYVTSFDDKGDQLEYKFSIRPGIYEIKITYSSPFGNKEYELLVNSDKDKGTFPQTHEGFATHIAGKYVISSWENSIIIGKGWGWFEIDNIELTPAKIFPIKKPEQKPADPQADTSVKNLLNYLQGIYGKKTLSGQHGFEEIAYICKVTGEEPAIAGFDLMEYSPSRLKRGADPKNLSEKIIKWSEKGGLVTLSWHWNAPGNLIDQEAGREWWKGFNADATTFDLTKALKPGTPEHKILLRDLDAIAVELTKLRDAGIPVLWRPLHEPQGNWFWWSAHGAENYVKLWRLMFDRFSTRHGLHNLLWVYSPIRDFENSSWYPGDDVVDVIGVDIYNTNPANMNRQWETLQKLYGDRKLIALAECGIPPDPEIMRPYQIHWLWVAPWFSKGLGKMPEENLKRIYSNKAFIKRNQLPKFN